MTQPEQSQEILAYFNALIEKSPKEVQDNYKKFKEVKIPEEIKDSSSELAINCAALLEAWHHYGKNNPQLIENPLAGTGDDIDYYCEYCVDFNWVFQVLKPRADIQSLALYQKTINLIDIIHNVTTDFYLMNSKKKFNELPDNELPQKLSNELTSILSSIYKNGAIYQIRYQIALQFRTSDRELKQKRYELRNKANVHETDKQAELAAQKLIEERYKGIKSKFFYRVKKIAKNFIPTSLTRLLKNLIKFGLLAVAIFAPMMIISPTLFSFSALMSAASLTPAVVTTVFAKVVAFAMPGIMLSIGLAAITFGLKFLSYSISYGFRDGLKDSIDLISLNAVKNLLDLIDDKEPMSKFWSFTLTTISIATLSLLATKIAFLATSASFIASTLSSAYMFASAFVIASPFLSALAIAGTLIFALNQAKNLYKDKSTSLSKDIYDFLYAIPGVSIIIDVISNFREANNNVNNEIKASTTVGQLVKFDTVTHTDKVKVFSKFAKDVKKGNQQIDDVLAEMSSKHLTKALDLTYTGNIYTKLRQSYSSNSDRLAKEMIDERTTDSHAEAAIKYAVNEAQNVARPAFW